jgi:hypothetical protein
MPNNDDFIIKKTTDFKDDEIEILSEVIKPIISHPPPPPPPPISAPFSFKPSPLPAAPLPKP